MSYNYTCITCPQCKRNDFRSYGGLQRHQNTFHVEIDDTSSSSSESSEEEQDSTQEQGETTYNDDANSPEEDYDLPWHTGNDTNTNNHSNSSTEVPSTGAQSGNNNSQTVH